MRVLPQDGGWSVGRSVDLAFIHSFIIRGSHSCYIIGVNRLDGIEREKREGRKQTWYDIVVVVR